MVTPTRPVQEYGSVRTPRSPPPCLTQPVRPREEIAQLHQVCSLPTSCASASTTTAATTPMSARPASITAGTSSSTRRAASSASLSRSRLERERIPKRQSSAKEHIMLPAEEELREPTSSIPQSKAPPLPRPSSLRRHPSTPLSRYPGVSVDLSNCRYEIVRHVFQNVLGFSVVSFDTVSTSTGVTDVLPGCQLYWSDRTLAPMRVHKLAASRCVANHFPGIEALCRKVSIGKLLSKLQTQFPEAYNFFPQTFVSYDDFTFALSRQQLHQQQTSHSPPTAGDDGGCDRKKIPSNYYICKPNGGCCGRGIVITDRVTPWMFDGVVRGAKVDGEAYATARQDVGAMDPCVVQQYISRPLLVQGRKCDLRCYVLITSMDPLEIYFHNEGIVRLCASPYEAPSDDNIRDPSIHLANYSVNKTVPVGNDLTASSNLSHCSTVAGGADNEEDRLDTRREEEDQTSLKWSFSRYNRYVLHQIQKNPTLLANAEARYSTARQLSTATTPGSATSTSTPHVILADYMVENLWSEIHDVVLKSIVAAYPSVKKQLPVSSARVSSRSHQTSSASLCGAVPPLPATAGISSSGAQRRASGHSREQSRAAHVSPFFELLGFDILVDENLKPWLIEINHSPSWATDSVFDFELKRRVLRDALERTVVRRFSQHRQQPTVTNDDGQMINSPRHSDTAIHTHCSSQRWASDRRASLGRGKLAHPPSMSRKQGANAAASWACFDEEYAAEGNGFQRIYPPPATEPPPSCVGGRATHPSELQRILRHQGVSTGAVDA